MRSIVTEVIFLVKPMVHDRGSTIKGPVFFNSLLLFTSIKEVTRECSCHEIVQEKHIGYVVLVKRC